MLRLLLTDTVKDAVVKMYDGNWGCLTVLAAIIEVGSEIDPYAAPVMVLLQLDELGIYGEDVWLLFKDICKEHFPSMIGILRAEQLGYLRKEFLHAELKRVREGVDWEMRWSVQYVESLLAQVKQRLPNFNPEWKKQKEGDPLAERIRVVKELQQLAVSEEQREYLKAECRWYCILLDGLSQAGHPPDCDPTIDPREEDSFQSLDNPEPNF